MIRLVQTRRLRAAPFTWCLAIKRRKEKKCGGTFGTEEWPEPERKEGGEGRRREEEAEEEKEIPPVPPVGVSWLS